jgi:two-component sensor histidine kinase
MHQRRCTSSGQESVNLSIYLNELAVETVTALDTAKGVTLSFASDELFPVALDDAVAIALVINELLTNAMKYAFDRRTDGQIRISITRNNAHLCITLSDNGRGLPGGFGSALSNGLGMLIVTALVGQIDGSLAIIPCQHGTEFLISFPNERLFRKANA